MDFWFPAFFVLAMFAGAIQPKALGTVIAFCMGLATLYPSQEAAGLLTLLFVPAYILASFRD